GIPRRYTPETKRQMGVTTLPSPKFRQMDASQMSFPDASFDFIYSFNTFEPLPEPAKILTEAVRVLRPGGVIFTKLHLYTSDSGCHDLRIIRSDREHIPFWPHLRPDPQHILQT